MTDLLTTSEVQQILNVDRTTIYRMVESGRLPAIRVGKQWRFSRPEIERWLRGQAVIGAGFSPVRGEAAQSPAAVPSPSLSELLPLQSCQMIQDAFADALGVMIVVTDMNGQPVTRVSNACGLYEIAMTSGDSVARCIQNWQRLAGTVTLEPKFTPSDLGLLCARGLIRSGNELKGMVFLGGIAPDVWPPSTEDIAAIVDQFAVSQAEVEANIDCVHRLDRAGRDRALGFIQRIADIFSHVLEERKDLYARLQAIASLTSL